MKKIVDLIIEELKPAFTGCGYDEKFIRVTLSNRPDLCEYQCNGAMAAAKAYKKKPIDIANELVEQLKDSSMFSEINAVMPGFINIRLNPEYLAGYVNRMASDGSTVSRKQRTRRRLSWITAGPMWRSLFMWGISGLPLSARALSVSAVIWGTRP